MLNDNITSNGLPSSRLILQQLYQQYPRTYLSIADLDTYEIIILLIYGAMIIFSFCTNFIAIIIFLFGRRSRSELAPFLLNLSIFNIIMTVYCIPFTITSVIFQRWLYARALCIVLDGMKTFSVSGVLLTLITIAIDRYCVVKYPLTLKIYSAKKRNLYAILTIWILSILLALLWSPARSLPSIEKHLWVNSGTLLNHYLNAVTNSTNNPKANIYLRHIQYKLVDTLQCLPNKSPRSIEIQRTILIFLQTYFIPLFILAFVYLRIAIILWQRKNDANYDLQNVTRKNFFTTENLQFKRKLKQGIKMLIAVVVLYAILWLPMNVFQLCLRFFCYPETKYQKFCAHPTLARYLYIAAHLLTVSNTAINPIIYGFTNNRFRSDIRQLRRRIIHCRVRSPFYSQTRSARTPEVLEVHPNRNSNVKGLIIKRMNNPLHPNRPFSQSDQTKSARTAYTNSYPNKDHSIIKLRTMRRPTGMGAGTGHHYRNVAAQMQAYIKKPRQRTAHYTHYQKYQEPDIMNPEVFMYSAQQMGVPPTVAGELHGFAVNMMRDLFG